jgi:enamine deaminase RidA (YjgF/YER057c/UK114 family)
MHDIIERYEVVDAPGRPLMSLGVTKGDWVAVCLTAADRSADAAGQARQVLAAIERHLEAAGSRKSLLLTAQVWMRDMHDMAAVRDAWNAWVDASEPPACSFIGSAMARPDILVEIKVTAARRR